MSLCYHKSKKGGEICQRIFIWIARKDGVDYFKARGGKKVRFPLAVKDKGGQSKGKRAEMMRVSSVRLF